MNRRDALLKIAGLGAGAMLPRYLKGASAPGADMPGSLKSLAGKAGLRVGVQASKANLEVDTFARFVAENFSLLTPGFEFKWGKLRPTPDSYNFADADWMVDFCQAHHLAVHGHNLCWNSANPAWTASVLNRGNARQSLTDHITTVVTRYRGRIDSWDVVNEPVVFWSKRPDGLYPGMWVNLVGEDYLDVAFHAVKAADPGALRVLNCYCVEQENPDNEKTRQLTLALLHKLLRRGVPVQAVGVESHLDGSVPPAGRDYEEFLKQVRGLGLQVLITELDVDDTHLQGDVHERDAEVARCYADYLEAVVPVARVTDVIFWTPSNRWNWLDSTNLPPKFHRMDGQPHRAGLLDAAMQKTPTYEAAANALRKIGSMQAPHGSASLR